MPLTAGTRLGHYSIVSVIGAGGMGEVYLAEDSRLRRRVALKVLPSHLAIDETAEKRLLREARAAATLDHPNICTVYDVGEADGHGFIAMQYLEGSTLAERVKKGPLTLDEAIAIGKQVAHAVAEAHRHGIVHRDVKPQNIIVSPANHATVLDFGLAKDAAPTDVDSATASVLTESGVVSGTVSYMSPEQARGETVDARSDIFSFGIVLHETIAGSHPFAHPKWADTLAAILTQEPRAIERAMPPELRRILRKCLEKDRDRRYQTMRDVAIDLDNLAQEISHPSGQSAILPPEPRHFGIPSRALTLGGAALLATAAIAAIVFWIKDKPAAVATAYEPLTDFTDSATAAALSPDGRLVTFIRGGDWFMTTKGQVYVKMLPNGEAVRLTDDPYPKFGPVFSADGSRIAYTLLRPDPALSSGVSWDTWTVPVSGGSPTRLLSNAAGLSWIDSRHVLFSEIQPGTAVHMALVTSTEDRREARQIYLPAHERGMAHFSSLSPDRRWLLVVEMGRMGTFERCRVLPFDGSDAGRLVGPSGACTSAAWSRDGRWMYFAAQVDNLSHLWRQRFPDGAIEPLTSGAATEEQGVAIAPDGRSLVTSIGTRQSSLWLHTADGERLLSSEGYAYQPALSSSGQRLYYLLRRLATFGLAELRVMDLASQKSDRLLPDFSVADYAVSRDEKQIAFTTIAADGSLEIWLAALDRRTAPRRIVQGGDSVSFGANHDLVFRSLEGHANFMTRIGIDGQNRVRLSDLNPVEVMSMSPDGRWVTFIGAFGNKTAGTIAVPVYGGEPKYMCSDLCGATWSPDGTLLYVGTREESAHRILLVPLKSGQVFPEFPADGDEALAAWRKLPNARVISRARSVPGPDQSTYIETKADERRNLFRVPLQ